MNFKNLARVTDSLKKTIISKIGDSVKTFYEVDSMEALDKLASELGEGWSFDTDWGYAELQYDLEANDTPEEEFEKVFEEKKKQAKEFLPKVKKVYGNAECSDDGECIVYITARYKNPKDEIE